MTRVSGVLSSLLFLAFIVGIASAWARGLQIDCGCFGGGGFDADATEKYPWEIARDVGLLALSLLLVWRPHTPYAVDNILFRRPERTPDVEEAPVTARARPAPRPRSRPSSARSDAAS